MLAVLVGAAAGLTTGCAAVSNPLIDGIPVRRLPPEVIGVSKDLEQPVPLADLARPPSGPYRLAAGDVLGVWIEGVLGEKEKSPPVSLPEPGSSLPPGIGYPLPVRENGTVPLPLIEAVNVDGLTLEEAQDKIVKAYTDPKKILQPGRERVIVTLLRPRRPPGTPAQGTAGAVTVGSSGGYGSALTGGGGTFVSETRRTAGFPLQLPAYENDLLNALTRTGGLPGYEAEPEVVIERGAYRPATGGPPAVGGAKEFEGRGRQTIRVPLRLYPGQPLPVRLDDLVLQSGDVVLVKARRGEVFFTGGLLPTRSFPLPRDRDLDVLEAVATVGGALLNGGFNTNNLNGQLLQTGLGFPSPSHVTILRRSKTGGQIPILVNLNRAAVDPRERIPIQPGDVLILQQTVREALAQYFTTNFRFDVVGTLIRRRDLTSIADVSFP
jgi:hypothetical protein